MIGSGWLGKGSRAERRELREIYAMIRDAMNRMALMPNSELAAAKREMYVLEDLLWQAINREGR